MASPDPAAAPLAGRTLVVCRAEADAESLLGALGGLGATALPVPLLEVQPPPDGGAALARAVAGLDRYRWLVCTSANGVRAVADVIGDRPIPPTASVAAVGPATADAFARAGIPVHLTPDSATAADLADAFPRPAGPAERVLAPLAEAASSDLTDGLTAKGYVVDRVHAYRTAEPPPVAPERAAEVARADAVLLTAPSVADRFADRFGVHIMAICIGPRTAQRARERGWRRPVVAADYTEQGLIDATLAALAGPAPPTGSGAEASRFGSSTV